MFLTMKIDNKIISEIGSKEKYIRSEHYNSLKVWWARRPITAVRSILINEIISKHTDFDIDEYNELVYDLNPSQTIFNKFSKTYKTNKISVLDVFAGGGSIPLESSRLGCKTFSSELNPIASLLQETNFNFVKFKNFDKVLKKEGDEIINSVEKRLDFLYRIDNTQPYVIFWGKSIICEGCKSEMSLSRIKYLSKRKSKVITIENEELRNSTESESKREKQNFDFKCKNCEKEYSFSDIKKYCKTNSLGSIPIAICYHYNGKKEYKYVTQDIKNELISLNKKVEEELEELSTLIPKENVLVKNGVINPTMYDLRCPSDFFNKRQLLVLLTLIDEVIKKYPYFVKKYDLDFSKQIVLGLTSLIEFLVDWNSNGTMWISQNEQTGRSLAGPGVGMKWDYIEINPFYKSGSNLRSKLDRVTKTFSKIKLNNSIEIINGTSSHLPIKDNSIDIVLTDPPYFDSIDYTALSEFFRPWFEKLIQGTYDENIQLKNDIEKEAIVQLSKSKTDKRDSHHYQTLMTEILSESKRVLKKDGKIIVMYSHKTIEGWEVIANSIKDSGLFVKTSYPLDMERAARPRGMSHQALNGVIIFELVTNESSITSVNSDINKSIITNDEFDNSHIPIYIASLSCKEFSLTSKTFGQCYSDIIQTFNDLENKNIDSGILDELVKLYLISTINGSLEDLSINDIKILKSNNLLDGDKLKTIDKISIDEILSNEIIFRELVILFQNQKNNSSTKITLDEDIRLNAKVFFQFLSGNGLNTVRDRSFDSIIKTSRLIMSKFSEV
jgi:putative DNA methylase